jgi:hypothetical protein
VAPARVRLLCILLRPFGGTRYASSRTAKPVRRRDKGWIMRRWQVTRFCCLSGMCFDCRAIVTGGPRKRIVVVENVTEQEAAKMAQNWAEYSAEASEMPEAENVGCPSMETSIVPSPDSVLTDTIRSSASRPRVMVVNAWPHHRPS